MEQAKKVILFASFFCLILIGTTSKAPCHSFADWWPYDIAPPYSTLSEDELDCPTVIALSNCQFDTRRGEPEVPTELKYSDAEAGMYYYIVQFSETVDFATRRNILDPIVA